MNKYAIIFFLLLFFLFFRPDPIPINSDDFWVFNIVRDIVENPSYYSLSGSGYRIVHKLTYLPFFWLAGFDVDNLAVITTFITALFSTGLAFLTYKFFSRIYCETAGILAAFLLGTSNAMYYTTWYWSSTHLIIGTFFLLSAIYAYYFAQRKFLWWSMFAGLAMFTRESFAIPVVLITAYLIWHNRSHLNRRPDIYFTIIPLSLFATYLLLNKIFLGAFINPAFAGKVQFGLENLAMNDTYWRHVSQTLLLPLLVFFCILFLYNFFHKGITISNPVLLLWFSGHVITLLMTANADKRYLIPFMPLVFAFGANQANEFFAGVEKNFRVLLIAVLVLWHAVFLSRQMLFVFSPAVWTFVLHVGLYGSLVYLLHLLVKPSIKTITTSIFLVLLLATSLVQLSMSYSFYIYQYDWTTTPNAAVAELAKTAQQNAVILTNNPNSITTPDVHWFTAYGRPDITSKYIAQANISEGTYLWSTPESKMETDETGKKAEELGLKAVKAFGGGKKKYPLLKISSSAEKRWQQFFSTGRLFSVEESQGYVVKLYTTSQTERKYL